MARPPAAALPRGPSSFQAVPGQRSFSAHCGQVASTALIRGSGAQCLGTASPIMFGGCFALSRSEREPFAADRAAVVRAGSRPAVVQPGSLDASRCRALRESASPRIARRSSRCMVAGCFALSRSERESLRGGSRGGRPVRIQASLVVSPYTPPWKVRDGSSRHVIHSSYHTLENPVITSTWSVRRGMALGAGRPARSEHSGGDGTRRPARKLPCAKSGGE